MQNEDETDFNTQKKQEHNTHIHDCTGSPSLTFILESISQHHSWFALYQPSPTPSTDYSLIQITPICILVCHLVFILPSVSSVLLVLFNHCVCSSFIYIVKVVFVAELNCCASPNLFLNLERDYIFQYIFTYFYILTALLLQSCVALSEKCIQIQVIIDQLILELDRSCELLYKKQRIGFFFPKKFNLWVF